MEVEAFALAIARFLSCKMLNFNRLGIGGFFFFMQDHTEKNKIFFRFSPVSSAFFAFFRLFELFLIHFFCISPSCFSFLLDFVAKTPLFLFSFPYSDIFHQKEQAFCNNFFAARMLQ
ncbi:MAG: hypothetical protein J6R89_00680 [Clostridia bacterium]|nr:hypothetical protein [Clostridia bacterium]